jgi:hypothetical protein
MHVLSPCQPGGSTYPCKDKPCQPCRSTYTYTDAPCQPGGSTHTQKLDGTVFPIILPSGTSKADFLHILWYWLFVSGTICVINERQWHLWSSGEHLQPLNKHNISQHLLMSNGSFRGRLKGGADYQLGQHTKRMRCDVATELYEYAVHGVIHDVVLGLHVESVMVSATPLYSTASISINFVWLPHHLSSACK